MDKFFVIINNTEKGSWGEWIWKDIEQIGSLYLDNSTLKKGSLLWKLKQIHFSNKINHKIRLPLKSIWNNSLCIQPEELNENDRNYIVFQGNIKFSPSYIAKLKREKNVCLILYLYDTISTLGIGKTKEDFDRYCDYYHIDYAFTFDFDDSKRLNIPYFDLYSSYSNQTVNVETDRPGLFYVGSCRSKERLNILHGIYIRCKDTVNCDFYLVGVEKEDCLYPEQIHYNRPLAYDEVMDRLSKNYAVLEITNPTQSGYTVRFKEAISHGKQLISNNKNIKSSKYYNPNYMMLYEDIEDIDPLWIGSAKTIDYKYTGEFSPLTLAKKIIDIDKEGKTSGKS